MSVSLGSPLPQVQFGQLIINDSAKNDIAVTDFTEAEQEAIDDFKLQGYYDGSIYRYDHYLSREEPPPIRLFSYDYKLTESEPHEDIYVEKNPDQSFDITAGKLDNAALHLEPGVSPQLGVKLLLSKIPFVFRNPAYDDPDLSDIRIAITPQNQQPDDSYNVFHTDQFNVVLNKPETAKAAHKRLKIEKSKPQQKYITAFLNQPFIDSWGELPATVYNHNGELLPYKTGDKARVIRHEDNNYNIRSGDYGRDLKDALTKWQTTPGYQQFVANA